MSLFSRRQSKDLYGAQPDVPPRTEMDSLIREMLHRLVEHEGPIKVNMDLPRVPGTIKWASAMTPTGSRELTWWFEPAQEFQLEYARLREELSMFNEYKKDEEQLSLNFS